MTPEELLATWNAQQTAFMEFRDLRVRAMLEVLAASQPEDRPLRVLDLACGPGCLGAAVAERFPDAQVVGVDRDPILLRLGRETNRYPDRVSLLDADLTDPDLAGVLGHQRFDAAVSATALHWLQPDELVSLYLRLPQLLSPGAVFLNADHLLYDAMSHPFLSGLSEAERERFRVASVKAGAMTWDDWWRTARSQPGWEAESQLWQERWATKSVTVKVSLDFHRNALRAAGFTEAAPVFRWFDDVVTFARLPH